MNSSNLKFLLTLILFPVMMAGSAQTLQHPAIWTTQGEKQQVLQLVEQYDWAKSIVHQLHERVDEKLLQHQINPNSIIEIIPAFAKADNQNSDLSGSEPASAHNRVLSIASDAGMLYFLTEDEKYAQLAADILSVYIDTIAPKTPSTTTICGNAFYDSRTSYEPFAIAYDFIYPYVTSEGATVYNKKKDARIPFDNVKAQKAIANMVGNALMEYGAPDDHGKFISNHPILTAPGVLFGILCIEDDAERERLFHVFWETGTAHQNSYKHTILPMFGKQGVWPESTSYSFMPAVTLVLNIIDRIYPEMNVTADYTNIFEGNFLFDNLRMPDRRFVRYGDSKRNNDGTKELYRYTLHIAQRRGYTNLAQQAKVAIKQASEAEEVSTPELTSSPFNNYEALELFWGIPIPEKLEGTIDFQKPAVIVEHAGIALQRNYVDRENELYGLCGIIGGAHYVHSHCTGITMELYGVGYVMAPNAGLPQSVAERQIPLHENYFRLYAGNNTVLVNGTSHGLDKGSWKDESNVWQNTTINIASEPLHLENPVCRNFNFATQFLKDEVNHCDQQRTLSIVRTSETTAYYLDIFRSKSMDENKFHDYIYHNIGDETFIGNAKGKELQVKETDRYQNDIGDIVHSPGWRYFENTRSTEATDLPVKICFHIAYDDRYMHMFVPGGTQREYTKALAPPTREARNGYVKKKTQVLLIRQQGEAWNRPYISVFEPSLHKSASVQSIEPLLDGQNTVGVIVISKVENTLITDYIISHDNPNASYTNNNVKLHFEGRFGIVRAEVSEGKTKISLYIGEGKILSFGDHNIVGNQKNTAFETF